MEKSTSKLFLYIVNEIDRIIHDDHLQPGDKLPSERELAERLKVGRSSVREALRALELLDLIKTKKGGGTFIQESGGHRLAGVLASFFLRDPKAGQDIMEARKIIEVEAVRLASRRITGEQLTSLKHLLEQSYNRWLEGVLPVEEDYLFHKTLVESSHNRVMLCIWQPLVEYSKAALEKSLSRQGRPDHSIREHERIVQALEENAEEKAVKALRNHLENSRF
ncbi:GntR family transcriptional regulator, transcriptional repressor for pyruvate dehydrogenase complex [Evansella caseinilytica]|uniref:GntR family transcriptional regulator, transcriptional repressor for pyruvate dehydrogenase complex n=1 Tax=Evansella caseinilytica TaxID=1503961 RepID=A0A1H3TWI9_9BACI|nr:FadR/GntR family transcriptional regulator [Evansella caseinilytica]SDZ54576.1 GntR family transcriptional regulator, transcriptional repressor for pyruvate dehydrogenase complex [Evansella caseinilytica]